MNIYRIASIPFFNIKSKAPRQVSSDNWEERVQILDSDVNLFSWKRLIDFGTQRYLNEILAKRPKPIKIAVNRINLQYQLDLAKRFWDDGIDIDGDTFWKDVSFIIRDFLDFSKSGCGIAHLSVIENDACRKFHTDGYALRLFTTYLGRGTEWLAEKDTNRKGLGRTNKLIIKDPSQIRRMEPFEVAILKGEPADSLPKVKGIVHRSPEITSKGEKRIILRVDV